ncbi:hypothetical protein HNP33_004184 [Comamonas odontotermitis]|uniref:Uncharacterized protein n=1 Tax=Comamonas odontotermitis TaxID=379895 RepID=A0ABR6RLK7_9BURK|nr:hypothetical protein [Comamonas odontotermitis]MBB6580058.1 hypothetical protein [Comamonas odontotermitis]
MTSEKQSYLGEQQVQALNEKHGYFEYGDAQGDVSAAFANEAVAAYLRVNEEAQAVMAECGLIPRELLEGYRELREALNSVLLHFPTDGEMQDASYAPAGIAFACAAYDEARAALAKHKEV